MNKALANITRIVVDDLIAKGKLPNADATEPVFSPPRKPVVDAADDDDSDDGYTSHEPYHDEDGCPET